MSTTQQNLHQLHSHILEYLTIRSRIMSCHKLHTWNEFTAYNKYSDYSREELRREFLEIILPKVFTYNLTSIQRRKIEIFGTHKRFARTEYGFKEVPSTTNVLIEGVHFARCNPEAKLHRISCIVRESTETHEILPTADQKISAWTSAVNSTDEELAVSCLLSGEHLLSRVNESKEEFIQTGQLPPNLNPVINKKIVTLRKESEELSSFIVPDYN